jgi:phosphatidylserine/phosphatidylglycerophosphate/cardiolipin synthase-like enzyme/uncharacterized membrane protein YdjX (TVP38/TMEM64 family)
MDSSILQPQRNVWRIERASRAAVLIDAAAFFGAVRKACLKAERSIFIVGWDIDSRTRLVDESNQANDGYSPVLAEFLSELVATKPSLQVYILLWDFSVIYASERELFPRISLQWKTPSRVTLCLDDAVPFGSSQHQKLVVIDDALAFSGGLDLTQRRWDTHEHAPDNPERVDVKARQYPPFHDVQMMVDGAAAHALAILARQRWCNAHGTEPPIQPCGAPWPTDVAPDFEDVDIGIARTEPSFEGQKRISEVRTLFLDSIECAERSIYVENQFVGSLAIARRMARRLKERPNLEIVLVLPCQFESWVVGHALGDNRRRFIQRLKRASPERVRAVYPSVEDGANRVATMVHSKVMIVDDRLLRIGSANLNNRSMAVDTECDLVIEAKTRVHRAKISDIRNRLLADHCGLSADQVATEMATGHSLVAAVDRLSGNGHCLRAVDEPSRPRTSVLTPILKALLDPQRPLRMADIWKIFVRRTTLLSSKTAPIVGIVLALVALTIVWSVTPIAEIATRERVHDLMSTATGSPWAPLWVIVTFVAGGAVSFPVLILIVATSVTFGPWYGFVYALLGVLTSAIATYLAGALFGRRLLQSLLGRRWRRVRHELDERGILAVAAIRMVPVAPFTLVNLAAGASSIALVDYVAGTLIGMLPGLIAISMFGYQLTTVITEFSAQNVFYLLLVVLVWIGIVWGAQSLISRTKGRAR